MVFLLMRLLKMNSYLKGSKELSGRNQLRGGDARRRHAGAGGPRHPGDSSRRRPRPWDHLPRGAHRAGGDGAGDGHKLLPVRCAPWPGSILPGECCPSAGHSAGSFRYFYGLGVPRSYPANTPPNSPESPQNDVVGHETFENPSEVPLWLLFF